MGKNTSGNQGTWMVIVCKQKNTKNLLEKLYQAGLGCVQNYENGILSIFENFTTAKDFSKKVIQVLLHENRAGRIYFIPNKQYRMSEIHFGKVHLVRNIDKYPCNLLISNLGSTYQIPVTEHQVQTCIEFTPQQC